jgi:hypothetical protein
VWQYRRSARARIAATRPLPHRLYRPDLVRKFGLLSSAGKQSARTGLGHGLAGDRYRCSQKRAVAGDDLTVEQYELARRMSSDSFGDAAIATSGYGLGRYSRRIVLGLWAYAGLLEYLQHFLPGRHPSVEDFAASALGAMCGGLAVLLLGRSRVIRRICRM